MSIKNLKISAIALLAVGTLLITSSTYSTIKTFPKGNVKPIITNQTIGDNNQKTLYVFEKQVIETITDGVNFVKPANGGASYVQYKQHKEMFTRKIVSENKEVEGWNLIGIYDRTLNDNDIYVFRKDEIADVIVTKSKDGSENIYSAPSGYIINSSTLIAHKSTIIYVKESDIETLYNYGAKYTYMGSCDENLYLQYRLSIGEEIAIIELGDAKTKK